MRYRKSQEKAELMKPGETYKVAVDLWATSNNFLAGHKLRLEISSSNFPRFDRNPNTGEEPEHASRFSKATNTIVHDRQHPSALILPVVPRWLFSAGFCNSASRVSKKPFRRPRSEPAP